MHDKSILIVSHQKMISDVMALYFEATESLRATVVESVAAGLATVTSEGPFDLVVADFGLVGPTARRPLEQLVQKSRPKPVVLLFDRLEADSLGYAMQIGCAGVLLKSMTAKSALNAVKFIMDGETYFPLIKHRDSIGGDEGELAGLTKSEQTVLMLLSQGLANRDISETIRKSEPTVKMHVSSIMRKLKVNNRTRAVIVAQEKGLLNLANRP